MRKSRQETAKKNNVSKLRKLPPYFISQKLLLIVKNEGYKQENLKYLFYRYTKYYESTHV